MIKLKKSRVLDLITHASHLSERNIRSITEANEIILSNDPELKSSSQLMNDLDNWMFLWNINMDDKRKKAANGFTAQKMRECRISQNAAKKLKTEDSAEITRSNN